jgi:Niemann-Pick C1 protein
MSIFTIYLYVITFFVAVFTLDERRIAAKRNAIIPCIIHSDEKTKPCCQKNLMTTILQYIYSKFIFTKAGRIIVIMSVICITGVSIESLLQLRQKFDATWFIPQKTYYYKYVMQSRALYPEVGSEAMVLMGQLNYTNELPKIYKMSEEMENNTEVLHHLQSWTKPFREFVHTYYDKGEIKFWLKFLS